LTGTTGIRSHDAIKTDQELRAVLHVEENPVSSLYTGNLPKPTGSASTRLWQSRQVNTRP
jgi:hypothetical protein